MPAVTDTGDRRALERANEVLKDLLKNTMYTWELWHGWMVPFENMTGRFNRLLEGSESEGGLVGERRDALCRLASRMITELEALNHRDIELNEKSRDGIKNALAVLGKMGVSRGNYKATEAEEADAAGQGEQAGQAGEKELLRGEEEVTCREQHERATQCSQQRPQKRCFCPPSLLVLIPGSQAKLGDKKGLKLVAKALEAGLRNICQPHLRLLAAGALGLYNNKPRETICYRLDTVYRHRESLESFRAKNANWFRRGRRPAVPQDLLGVFRHPHLENSVFRFDEAKVFKRFAGTESWQAWQRDGTVNVAGVFSYLGLPDLRKMIDQEFAIYRYHHHTPPGTSRLGWLRNMYYSLVQQLVRQDPVWYALTVAARPDKLWRLISYPYITKDTDSGGETTGFLHLDLDLKAYLADGRGGNRLTSSLSLDDEKEDGCTVVVKGFHRHLNQWAQELRQRRWKGSGLTTNCSSIYRAEDRARWGGAGGVPCPAWGIRLTLPQLIHGSTLKSVRRRRTILPWFMGIHEDHERLEISRCVGWSELRRCHLDLEVPRRDPSGYGHRLGAPKQRFAGSVVLGSSSALGDALIGRRKWTDPEVVRERDLLMGAECEAAQEYVKRVRARLVEQYRVAFLSMVQIEQQQFGEVSYFAAGQKRYREGVGVEEELNATTKRPKPAARQKTPGMGSLHSESSSDARDCEAIYNYECRTKDHDRTQSGSSLSNPILIDA